MQGGQDTHNQRLKCSQGCWVLRYHSRTATMENRWRSESASGQEPRSSLHQSQPPTSSLAVGTASWGKPAALVIHAHALGPGQAAHGGLSSSWLVRPGLGSRGLEPKLVGAMQGPPD